MAQKILCLHHNDADGFGSAAIVGHYYGKDNVHFKKINYEDAVDPNDLHVDMKLIIVDFSLKEIDWELVQYFTKDIIWIDHHKSIFETNSPHHVDGIRGSNNAAIALTWKYFYPDIEIPLWVNLIEDHDLWKFKLDNTEVFQSGLYSKDLNPTSEFWDLLFDHEASTIDQVCSIGKIIQEYQIRGNKSLRKQFKIIDFYGYKCCCINARGNSKIFDYVESEIPYDIVMWYWFDGECWSYRLAINKDIPNDNIDISKICQNFFNNGRQGGGHKGVGGFSQINLISELSSTWELKNI